MDASTTTRAAEPTIVDQAHQGPPQVEAASSRESWFAVVFWIIILLGGGAIYWFNFAYESQAHVWLNVSTQPERVSGNVSFEGRPLANGVVQVTVHDAGTRRYIASATLRPDAQGGFSTSADNGALGIEANEKAGTTARPLRVTAAFTGTRAAAPVVAGKPDAVAQPVSGESTRYINASPPLGKRLLWACAAVFVVLLSLQLWVFTGDLGRRKARTLFVLMYFFTFWSLALPLVVSLVVAQNKYLVDSMESSPLGLIRARTTALAEPQWLINIGGVQKPSPIVVNRREEGRPLSEADAAAGAASAPTVVVATAEASAAADEAGITIQGGVTVPFFMVLLAMFGAGINMTLKVPAIQRAYEDVLSNTRTQNWSPLVAPIRMFKASSPQDEVVPHQTAGDIRRDLIENYMYLLSAPLLAIAVYYLLQVLATQVTQPVLVLMALATGLVSKAVVGGVIDFAEKRLLSDKRREGRAGEGRSDGPPLEAPVTAMPAPQSAPSPPVTSGS